MLCITAIRALLKIDDTYHSPYKDTDNTDLERMMVELYGEGFSQIDILTYTDTRYLL